MEYSLRNCRKVMVVRLCLNPYSNGILSESVIGTANSKGCFVLILILMEYSLRCMTKLAITSVILS